MKTLAFAIVVVACLFADGNHELLFGSSVFGLWLAACSESEIGERVIKMKGKSE